MRRVGPLVAVGVIAVGAVLFGRGARPVEAQPAGELVAAGTTQPPTTLRRITTTTVRPTATTAARRPPGPTTTRGPVPSTTSSTSTTIPIAAGVVPSTDPGPPTSPVVPVPKGGQIDLSLAWVSAAGFGVALTIILIQVVLTRPSRRRRWTL